MSEERTIHDGAVEVVLVPDDAASRQGLDEVLDTLGGRTAALGGADAADRVQEALRHRWPSADVLFESASAPGSTGRARWTIYLDGADAA